MTIRRTITRMRIHLLIPLFFALACTDSRTRALDGLRGAQLTPAHAKPDFTLTDTHGQPFAFRKATDGYATLLYFGYTNCDDVCPATMTNIAAALKTLSPADQSHIRVIFVTTDPARDTLPRLRSWLSNFDPRFIGLRGDEGDVNQIEMALGLPPSSAGIMPDMDHPGAKPTYQVGHSAMVLGFSPDDSLRTEYPSDFSRDDWKNDLGRLVKVR